MALEPAIISVDCRLRLLHWTACCATGRALAMRVTGENLQPGRSGSALGLQQLAPGPESGLAEANCQQPR
jgi:hypothetical protein